MSSWPKASQRADERELISEKLRAARAITRPVLYAVNVLFTVYYKRPGNDTSWRLWGNVPESALEEHMSAIRLRGFDFVVNDAEGRQVREGRALCRQIARVEQ